MTDLAKDCFGNGNVLMRKDGQTMKNIPTASKDNDELVRKQQAQPPAEHDGFNTHIKCRWCGGEIGEMYIPKLKDGRNGKPYEIIVNYEPCKACREKWNTMVVCVEITDEEPYPDCLPIITDVREIIDGYIDPYEEPEEFKRRVVKQMPSKDRDFPEPIQFERIDFYPTGRYVGVTVEAMRKYFSGDTSHIKNGMVIHVEEGMFDDAFSDYFEN